MRYGSWNEFIISGTVFSISKFLATASDIKASAFSHNSVTFTSLFLKIVAVAARRSYVSTMSFVTCC